MILQSDTDCFQLCRIERHGRPKEDAGGHRLGLILTHLGRLLLLLARNKQTGNANADPPPIRLTFVIAKSAFATNGTENFGKSPQN